MRRLWHDMTSHRLLAVFFLTVWVSIWGLVGLGYDLVFLLHFPLNLAICAVIVGWRERAAAPGDRPETSLFTGLGIALALALADTAGFCIGLIVAFMSGAGAYDPSLGWEAGVLRDIRIALIIWPIVMFIPGMLGSFLGFVSTEFGPRIGKHRV